MTREHCGHKWIAHTENKAQNNTKQAPALDQHIAPRESEMTREHTHTHTPTHVTIYIKLSLCLTNYYARDT
jgi:hypothetical protein